jgi:hypothetical protein
MTFQSTVSQFPAIGVIGDLYREGPAPRVQPYILHSGGTNPNVIGYAYTLSASPADTLGLGIAQTSNTATVGGTGVFAGILIQPKAIGSFGTTAGPLAPTLNVPENATGQLVTFGSPIVSLPAAANIGNLVAYDTTTGALSTVIHVPSSSTYNQSTTTATITGFVSGGTPIGVGSVFTSSTGAYLGTVQSLGTGTGGNGTYVVESSATVSGATAVTQPIAGAGKLFVPNAKVDVIKLTAAGIGIITLTN